jgi:hypothetical protein
MKRGESVSLIRPTYRIHYVLPCRGEKGKKTAEADIQSSVQGDRLFALLQETFPDNTYYPDLTTIRISHRGMTIVVSEKEKAVHVKITRAATMDAVIQTTELLSKVLNHG